MSERCVLGAAFFQRLQLPRFDLFDDVARDSARFIDRFDSRGKVGPAAFVNCADGEFRIERGAELVNQYDVQFSRQPIRENFTHWHCTTRNGKYQWVVALVFQ